MILKNCIFIKDLNIKGNVSSFNKGLIVTAGNETIYSISKEQLSVKKLNELFKTLGVIDLGDFVGNSQLLNDCTFSFEEVGLSVSVKTNCGIFSLINDNIPSIDFA